MGEGKSQLNKNDANDLKHLKQKEESKHVEYPVESALEDIKISSKVKDIDADDTQNLTLCAEYVKDIYKYLRKSEKRLMPSDYLPQQKEISEKMRTILIDWLIQVHLKFNLLQETLYLTVYT